jgi:hypothetical protein
MYQHTIASFDKKAGDDPVCANPAKHLKQTIVVK